MNQSILVASLMILAVIGGACQSEQQREAERRREDRDKSSAAFKAGEAAHEIAKKAAKVAAEAGRKLDDSARKAHEGWKEQERKDRRDK